MSTAGFDGVSGIEADALGSLAVTGTPDDAEIAAVLAVATATATASAGQPASAKTPDHSEWIRSARARGAAVSTVPGASSQNWRFSLR